MDTMFQQNTMKSTWFFKILLLTITLLGLSICIYNITNAKTPFFVFILGSVLLVLPSVYYLLKSDQELNQKDEIFILSLIMITLFFNHYIFALRFDHLFGTDAPSALYMTKTYFTDAGRINFENVPGISFAFPGLQILYKSISDLTSLKIESLAENLHPAINMLNYVFFYLLVRELFNKRFALLSTFILGWEPMSFWFGYEFRAESLAIVFFIASVYYLVCKKKDFKTCVIILVFLTSIAATHFVTSIHAMIILGIYVLSVFLLSKISGTAERARLVSFLEEVNKKISKSTWLVMFLFVTSFFLLFKLSGIFEPSMRHLFLLIEQPLSGLIESIPGVAVPVAQPPATVPTAPAVTVPVAPSVVAPTAQPILATAPVSKGSQLTGVFAAIYGPFVFFVIQIFRLIFILGAILFVRNEFSKNKTFRGVFIFNWACIYLLFMVIDIIIEFQLNVGRIYHFFNFPRSILVAYPIYYVLKKPPSLKFKIPIKTIVTILLVCLVIGSLVKLPYYITSPSHPSRGFVDDYSITYQENEVLAADYAQDNMQNKKILGDRRTQFAFLALNDRSITNFDQSISHRLDEYDYIVIQEDLKMHPFYQSVYRYSYLTNIYDNGDTKIHYIH